MARYAKLYSSYKTKTYASAAAMTIANAIKASIASAASVQTYSGAALNGSIGAGVIDLPQRVTFTTSVHAGSYVAGSAVTFTGTDVHGNALSEALLVTQVNGGETVAGAKGFATVSSIVVAAQNDTNGAWTFGVQDVILDDLSRQIMAGAAGNLTVGYADGSSDTIPCAANQKEPLLAKSVSSTSTCFPITIYL